MAEEKPPKLSVLMTFPRVKDFARDSNGDVLPRSLSGPDYIEAENQWTREKLIAIEEAKILRCVPPDPLIVPGPVSALRC